MGSSELSTLQRIEFCLNTLNHVLIGFVTIWMSWMCIRRNLDSVELHAWLCTLGFHLLMAEGIMSHYQGNVLTYTCTRKAKTTIHWVLLTLGGGLAIAGCIVVFVAEFSYSGTHFQTLHGRLGLASFILCCLSMLGGVSALYNQTLRKLLKPVLNKGIHAFVGLTTFVVAMVTLLYGYDTYLLPQTATPDFIILLKVITCLVIVLSSIGPIKSLYEKVMSVYY